MLFKERVDLEYLLKKWIKLLELSGVNTKRIVREDMEKELKKLNKGRK